MRFNGRRRLTAAVATVLAGVLAAASACSGGDQDGSSGGKITLTVDTFGEFGYEALYKQYEAAHPNVKIRPRKVSSLDDLRPRLQQWMATGKGAGDVVALEEGILPTYMQQRDKFVNLFDHGGAALQKNFLDWKWRAGLSPDGKQLVGLGTDIGPLGLCYRKDLFKKAGLPTERDEVSKLWPTWDAFFETGKRFQSRMPDTRFLDGPHAIMRTILLQEAGKSPGHTFFDTKNALVFDSNPAVKTAWDTTLRFQTERLTANHKIFTPPWISGIQRDGFAAIPCPSWMLGGIQEFHGAAGNGKWDVAAVPGGTGYWGGSWLAVPKQTKHPKEAADLAKFLSSPEGQLAAYEAKNPFPSAPKYYNDPVIADKKSTYFGDAPIGKIFGTAAAQVKPVHLAPKNEDVREKVEDVMTGVGQGKVKPEEAWQKAIEAARQAAR
ncbi:carbohydrate ABC transporter substrate-binding protein [Actinomadura craniellae]|uniref:Carbohydrate ABC transporter substrate-binding protein n=1 Tax=Actinomadura craniellae TaxID=2231787 RepID=A0A365GXS8_9ACTN|nr:extracellular solute-binding protein [Actinomadura craniellae]RAY11630.1 carbohydrate ABC transporter substrate-binding protein [Actinomadura craniellae]